MRIRIISVVCPATDNLRRIDSLLVNQQTHCESVAHKQHPLPRAETIHDTDHENRRQRASKEKFCFMRSDFGRGRNNLYVSARLPSGLEGRRLRVSRVESRVMKKCTYTPKDG